MSGIDAEDWNITADFPAAASFIQHVENRNGRVLVHCIAGVSRSVTIVLMYLMAIHKIRLRMAYDALESMRYGVKSTVFMRLIR